MFNFNLDVYLLFGLANPIYQPIYFVPISMSQCVEFCSCFVCFKGQSRVTGSSYNTAKAHGFTGTTPKDLSGVYSILSALSRRRASI